MGIETLVSLVVWLLIVGLIFWLLWWAIGQAPEPFQRVGRVIIAIVAVLVLVYMLLGFLPPMPHGGPLHR